MKRTPNILDASFRAQVDKRWYRHLGQLQSRCRICEAFAEILSCDKANCGSDVLTGRLGLDD